MTAQPAPLAGTTEIPVRRMDFEFDDSIPKYWFGNDPVRTFLLTALSATFPEGERMFMRAVRHFEPDVKDPELRRQVKAFIGQEAHHGKEHQSFNSMMDRKGIPVLAIEDFVRKTIAREEAFLGPKRMLAKTCALEHFTAMFAETLLEHPELIDEVDDRLKSLWLWHAVEESEHKSVAFDVYQDQVGSYWIRTSEMAATTLLFSFFTTVHTVQLLSAAKDKPARSGSRLAGLWKHRGIFAKLGRRYLDYYRPGFHPSQEDSSELRRQGLERLGVQLASALG
jgi:predicted metal-dependent hydrolase